MLAVHSLSYCLFEKGYYIFADWQYVPFTSDWVRYLESNAIWDPSMFNRLDIEHEVKPSSPQPQDTVLLRRNEATFNMIRVIFQYLENVDLLPVSSFYHISLSSNSVKIIQFTTEDAETKLAYNKLSLQHGSHAHYYDHGIKPRKNKPKITQ